MSTVVSESVSVSRSVSGATAVTVNLKDGVSVSYTAKCFETTVADGYEQAKRGALSLLTQIKAAMP